MPGAQVWPWVCAPLPGLAHVILGAPKRGLAFFLATTSSANLALLSAFGHAPFDPHVGLLLCGGLALSLAFLALFDAVAFAALRFGRKQRRARLREIAAGAKAFRRRDWGKARPPLEAAARPRVDSAAAAWLAALDARQGRTQSALRGTEIALALASGTMERTRRRRQRRRIQETLRGF